MRASTLALAILALSFASGYASAGNNPSVFLPNASAARVKALALDTALIKGWTLVESSPQAVLFETRLDQPASEGPPGVTPPRTTQLLIRTQFDQTETGTLVSASAEEHWWPGTERAWSDVVTRRYSDNLQRALRSLQQRWERFADAAKPSTIPAPMSPAQPGPEPLSTDARVVAPMPRAEPVPIEPSSDAAPVGLWAYYAERYARSLQCELDDRGAILIQTRQSDEIHRVFCVNRSPVMARCDRLGCGAPR